MSLVIDDDQPLFKMADLAYSKRKIEESEDISKNQQSQTSIASRVLKQMSQTHIDDYLEIFNGIISFMFYVVYAIGTFCDKANPLMDDCQEPSWMEFVEMSLMACIIADYLIFFFVSDNRIIYIFNTNSFVTYITVIPTALVRAQVFDQEIVTLFMLDFWKVLRLFSIGRVIKVFTRRDMPMARVWFRMVYIVFLIILVFAAAMQTVEN